MFHVLFHRPKGRVMRVHFSCVCLSVLPNEQSQTFRYHRKSFIKLDYNYTRNNHNHNHIHRPNEYLCTFVRLDISNFPPNVENGCYSKRCEMRWDEIRFRCDRVKMREWVKKQTIFSSPSSSSKWKKAHTNTHNPTADNDIEIWKTLRKHVHISFPIWILFVVNVHNKYISW